MLSARLRHKVPREFEGMEDVLTSSVFALLRTLSRPLASCLLARWAYGLFQPNPLQPDPPQVDFWPCHATPAGFLQWERYGATPAGGSDAREKVVSFIFGIRGSPAQERDSPPCESKPWQPQLID
jgi:hypothetical protein